VGNYSNDKHDITIKCNYGTVVCNMFGVWAYLYRKIIHNLIKPLVVRPIVTDIYA